MKKEKEVLFNGSQNDMCDAIKLGWENCGANLSDFQKIDIRYTKDLVIQAVKDIAAAKKIPGIAPRRSSQTNVKDIMKSIADMGIANWLVIFSFIEKLFPPEQWDSLKTAAGYTSYSAAAGYSWSSVFTLLEDGSAFLEANKDLLLGGGMHPEFPEAYATGHERFNDFYYQYIDAKQGVIVNTTTKADALNTVFKTFTSMSRDAKRTYRKDPVKKELFAYSKLLAKVAGTRKGGFHITLRTDVEQLPVDTSTIVFNPGNKTFYPNKKGVIIAGLKEGEYAFTLTTPGYKTITGSLAASTGVQHRVEFFLQNVDVATA